MGDWETKREQWRQRGERFGKTESGRGSWLSFFFSFVWSLILNLGCVLSLTLSFFFSLYLCTYVAMLFVLKSIACTKRFPQLRYITSAVRAFGPDYFCNSASVLELRHIEARQKVVFCLGCSGTWGHRVVFSLRLEHRGDAWFWSGFLCRSVVVPTTQGRVVLSPPWKCLHLRRATTPMAAWLPTSQWWGFVVRPL